MVPLLQSYGPVSKLASVSSARAYQPFNRLINFSYERFATLHHNDERDVRVAEFGIQGPPQEEATQTIGVTKMGRTECGMKN